MSIHDASMYVHDMIVYSFQFHVCYIIMNHYRIYTVYIYIYICLFYLYTMIFMNYTNISNVGRWFFYSTMSHTLKPIDMFMTGFKFPRDFRLTQDGWGREVLPASHRRPQLAGDGDRGTREGVTGVPGVSRGTGEWLDDWIEMGEIHGNPVQNTTISLLDMYWTPWNCR